MHPHRWFQVLGVSFLVGVGLASFYVFRLEHLTFILSVSIFISLVSKRVALFVVGVFVILGALWFAYVHLSANHFVSSWHSKDVVLKGVVVRRPEYHADTQHLVVEVSRVNDQESSGHIRVSTWPYPQFEHGDVLHIEGELQEPLVFEDFDYQRYLYRFGIESVLYYANVKKIDEQVGGMSHVSAWREAFEQRIERIFPEPHGAFLAGLLVGSRASIPDSLMEAFNRTGTTHIIAISGYNIAILFALVDGVLKTKLMPKHRWLVALGIIMFFVLFTGAPASVVRAAIMGLLVAFARNAGRGSQALGPLLLAALVMIIANPKILIFDVSFQLSFLATASIMLFADWVDARFQWLPSFYAIRESVVLTLSAQILVLPLIITTFGTVSPVSVAANILILPLIPLIMATGFVATLFTFVSESTAFVVSFVPRLLLDFEIFAIESLAELPFAAFSVTLSPLVLLCFLPLVLLGLRLQRP